MEAQIHLLEQEAYSAVLRAFKAQSDAITWEKEGLITELRKELRVSDDEHRELLTRVNADDIIRRIREWRQAASQQPARFSASQSVHDVLPSPTGSMSRKRQKTSQPHGQALTGLSSMKSMQYPSTGSAGRHFITRGSSGALLTNEIAEATASDPLIGRKVWTRSPEDNQFYEAVISDYDPAEGRHALVYGISTENEAWWVDLKEISPEDIRWEGEDPGIYIHGGNGVPGRGINNKSMNVASFVPVSARGRVFSKVHSKRDSLSTQNGFAKKVSDEIELLNTETLVKEVERVFGANYPDPHELEKAKLMLKEHEQALIEAIARLADASEGESDGEQHYLHVQAMEHE